MPVILFIIGLLLSADGLYFAATTSMGVGEAAVIAIGICFILWGVFYDAAKKKAVLKFFKRLFAAAMALLVIYSCAICVFGYMDNADYHESYAIVLGAGLYGDQPSRALESRLDKTAEYLNLNKEAIAIVSGGKGEGEAVSEAYAMKKYLTEHGIDEERIVTEEASTSTYENFSLSAEYIGDESAVLITSDFHVLRAMQMAKINGIDAHHIGASTPVTLLPIACAREVIAQIAAIRYF